MKKRIGILRIIMGLIFLGVCSLYAQIKSPYNKDKVLLLEAEDFHPMNGGFIFLSNQGWVPIKDAHGNYMVDTIGASHFSGEMLLQAKANVSGAKAYKMCNIPETGAYKIWARYEDPLHYNVLFQISIIQNHKIVFQHEYGRDGAIKLWFFNGGFHKWVDWPWGVEGAVDEGYIAHLQKGPATVILTALKNPQPGANRNIDFIFLTNNITDSWIKDKAYTNMYPELDYILRPGRVYVKLINSGKQSCYFNINYSINRIPWGRNIGNGFAGKRGLLVSAPSPLKPSIGWLKPGESTPWIDISYGDTCHSAHLWINQIWMNQNTGMDFKASVAGKNKKAVKTVSFSDPKETTMDVEIPPYPEKDPNGVKTAYQIIKTLDNYLAGLPNKGPEPEKTLFLAGYGPIGRFPLNSGTKTSVAEIKFLKDIGINTYVGGDDNHWMLSQSNLDAMAKYGYYPVKKSIFYGEYFFPPTDQNIEEVKRWFNSTPDASKYFRGFYFGDEVGPLSLAQSSLNLSSSEFINYLKSKGFNPEDFKTKGQIVPEFTAQAAASNPELYVESYKFIENSALTWMKKQTDKIRADFGKNIVIGSNFSPACYFWPIVADYINAFRYGGLSFAQEDDYFWQTAEITSQVNGYLLDAFRSGLINTPHSLICNYVMPHYPGNTDTDFLLTCYDNWIHGGKALDFFDIGQPFSETENYIKESHLTRFKDIHDVIQEAGTVDKLLHYGKLQSDPVGIYISESNQVWDMSKAPFTSASDFGDKKSGVITAYNEERKCLWYLMRDGHIQPDFLINQDLTDGRLNKYKVLYFVGKNMSEKSAEAIASWVKQGGILVSMAGGGFLNQFNQPMTILNDVYGVKSQNLEMKDVYIRSKIELPRLKPLDTITTGSIKFSALAFKQTFNIMPGTKVFGTYSDGTAAIIGHSYGKGMAFIVGTLPSLYYVQQALLPLKPPDRGPYAHFKPTNFNPVFRNMILSPVKFAKIVPWVNVSAPLVETNKLVSKYGILLPVANYGVQPLKEVTFQVKTNRKIHLVKSMNFGRIAFQQKGDIVSFTLPVKLTDFITLK
jgi:hypothetical protein